MSTDTVAKGDEKSPQYKPAMIGAGRKIMVPPFIASGKWSIVGMSMTGMLRLCSALYCC